MYLSMYVYNHQKFFEVLINMSFKMLMVRKSIVILFYFLFSRFWYFQSIMTHDVERKTLLKCNKEDITVKWRWRMGVRWGCRRNREEQYDRSYKELKEKINGKKTKNTEEKKKKKETTEKKLDGTPIVVCSDKWI